MRKIFLLVVLTGVGFFARAQTNPFPTIDSLEKFVNRYIRNSPVEAFQNLRMNTALIGLSRFLRGTSAGSGIDTVYMVNDTTLRIVTYEPQTFNVILRDYWKLDGSGNLVNRWFPGSKIEINKRLSILDSGYVASGPLSGTNPGEGAGYKNFWYQGKAAYRSGFTDAGSFNDAFIGQYSTSFGYNATASGLASFSAGIGTLAQGQGSIALGGSGTQATGANSIAGGLGSVSGGAASIAFGNSADASGANAFAAGFNPSASGISAAAFNQVTRALGDYSAAFGEGSDAVGKWHFVAGLFNRSNYSLVIPQFIIGRFSDTTIGAELFRIGWGSHVGGPKDNIFSIDTLGRIRMKAPITAGGAYTVLVYDAADEQVKQVDAGDISGAGSAATRTEVRIGIGVDTASIPGNEDTVHLEENRIIGTIDQKIAVVDTYVANDGDDADDGETETTAKETLTEAADSLISKNFAKGYSTGLLRANSIFREQFSPTVNNIRLGAYGMFDGRTVKLPMISSSDVIPSGADTSSLYKISITHSLPSGNPGYDYFVVVEIDTALEKYYPVLARRYLRVATSIANADATPGSFYQPSMTSPTPVYINTTEGSVGSNKYRYEIATRLSSIYATGQTGKYTYLWLENGVSGYGTVGGTNGGVSDIYLSKSILQGGATHTSVIKSGMVENNVYITGSLGGTNGNTGHVFYEGNGLGNYGVFRRNIMFDYEAFLLAHQGEGVNDPIEYVAYQDNYLFGDSTHRGGAMGTGVVKKVEVSGNYLEYSNSFYRGGAQEQYIVNNVFRDIESESGVEVPSALSRISHVVDNLIEFFPPNSGAIITMWSVNQDGHNTNFDHNTVYVKSLNPGGESAQVFARNSAAANNTPFNVSYNIFISSTPTGTFTKVVTVDQNSVANATVGWVSDYNVYINLSGSGFRWVVTNPVGGDPNKDGLAEWQSTTDQDDNSIEIDLTASSLQDVFVDPENGNWALTNSANANLIRALLAGKRNPPTFYPKRPLPDEAVMAMINGGFKSPTEIWQTPNYAGGSSTPADGSETIINPIGDDIAVSGTGTVADPYVIDYTGVGGASDTSRLWHVSGNNLGSTGKLGALTGHTTVFISHNIMRAAIRAVGGFAVGDTVGLTSTRLVSFKNTTELQGIDVLGPISGTTPSINIQTAHTATANSQVLEGINLTGTYATGGFTGVSVRPLNLNVSFASGTVIGRVGNIGASGNSEFRVEDPNGAVRILSTGGMWATGTNAFIRPASSSFSVDIQRSTGVVGTTFDSTGQHTGGSTRPLQKFRVSGNAYAATQGVTGAQAAFVAGVYQNTSTAAAGTVTHASVIGIAQSTLASTNSITTTNASSLYIENAPLGSSTNTITNPYALYVAAGKSFFGDDLTIVDAAAAQLNLVHTAGSVTGSVRVDGNGNWAFTGSNTSPFLALGGVTSAFAGFVRDGASIAVRVGDNSAYAPLKVLDQAYDPTTFDGNIEVPTKNALRDLVEGSMIQTLWKDFTITTSTGTSETDLYTYTTPANTLSVDGQFLEYEISGVLDPTSNNGGISKTLRFYWAGTEVHEQVSTLTNFSLYTAKMRVVRVSSANVRVFITLVHGAPGSGTAQTVLNMSNDFATTFSGTNIIKITGQSANASEQMDVRYGVLRKTPN